MLLIDEIRYIARVTDRCVNIQATGFSNLDSNCLIFVYGTLRAGGSNEWRMSQAKFISKAYVLGKLYRVDWYPGLVLDSSAYTVFGEIYFCDSILLAKLDDFEGQYEYRRVQTTAITENGDQMVVQVWEYRRSTRHLHEIVLGDWLNEPLF